jgi:hypothetical protein
MSSTRQKREKKKREKERKRRAQRSSLRPLGIPVVDFGETPPPGIEKMSEVFENFLEPYWDLWETEGDLQMLLNVGMRAWNAALVSGKERERRVHESLKSIPSASRGDLLTILVDMIRRKETRFSQNTRAIVGFKATFDEDDDVYLQVASTVHSV